MPHRRSALTMCLLGSLALIVVGLVVLVRVPGPDHHVPGEITGFGGKLDGSECYMNVSYTVDGKNFRMKTSPDKRWCGYGDLFRIGDQRIPVYYDPAAPGEGTLTPRGSWPRRAVALGVLTLLGCVLTAGRRARRERRETQDDLTTRPVLPR